MGKKPYDGADNLPLLSTNDAPEREKGGGLYPYWVLFVLTGIYFTNQIDRLVLPFVVSDVRKDISFSDGQYSLLIGYGFSIIFVLVGLLIGPLVDRYNRTVILLVGVIFWSTMTLTTGFAKKYVHLLVTRIGLGIGTALCNPAAFAILSDYFPPEKRTLSNSVYSMSIYLGGGLGSILSGVVAKHDIDKNKDGISWRFMFQLFAFIGFGFSALGIFTLREPTRGRFSKSTSVSKPARKFAISETVQYLMASKTAWRFIVAAGIRNMGGLAFGGFVPSYLRTSYPDNVPLLLMIYGGVTCFFGAAASFGGGAISRKLGERTKRAGAYVSAIGTMIGIPFVLGIMFSHKLIHANNAALAFALSCLALEYLTAEVWGGPSSAIISNILPAGMQGIGFAVYFAMISLIGGAGPEILALFLQEFAPAGVSDTRTYITAFIIVASYTLSSLGFLISSRSVEEDIKVKESVEAHGDIPAVSPTRKVVMIVGIVLLSLLTIALVVLSLVLKPKHTH